MPSILIISHIFKLLAGIGLFLFAMYLIEESLKNLSGRNFKRFLQRVTKTSVGAVSGGAVVTAILQSSSMVSLMVLAFVGAGVFTMKNALAIILGANLGTTLDSWLVASLGFKMSIELIAYPVVFIGGLLLVLSGYRKTLKYLAYFLLGFGLLFVGLSLMKTAMEAEAAQFDFLRYADMSLAIFLLIGFLITLLVQSSSVTMALALSALHTGVIGFVPAVAIVLGSETGTTIKILLTGIGGNASKKRVVLGNFLFNVFLTLLALLFLNPVLFLIHDILKISDPLISLVTFSTLINLASIILFIPFLNPFTKFLEKLFKDTDVSAAAFIGHANISETETAVDLFSKETAFFIHNSMLYNVSQFGLDTGFIEANPEFKTINEKRNFSTMSPEEKYQFLRLLQGELNAFFLKLRKAVDDREEAGLSLMISAVRSSMYAAKCIKDVRNNINNLIRSSKDIKYNFFIHHKKKTEELYVLLNDILRKKDKDSFDTLHNIYIEIENNYSESLNNFYKDAQNAHIDDMDISTALNFNRELFTSNKAMLMAVKDFILDEKQADEFNDIPVYKS